MQKAAANSDPAGQQQRPGLLSGIRVVEAADERAEFCGLLLAGLGADVVKIEPPSGTPTRLIGPFYGDVPDPERSLFFWTYNRGKRSAIVNLESKEGRDSVLDLLGTADVLLDSTCGELNHAIGFDIPALGQRFPSLVTARLTPFGDGGPWKEFKSCDLVHLALGGVMMNCGYDSDPLGRYDLPPIAPQVWHAFHMACEQLLIGVLAALLHRQTTGEGQDVSCAVHDAVAKNTELDVMSWVMRRAMLARMTCRHAHENPTKVPNIAHTKDGRWYTCFSLGKRDEARLVPFLQQYGMAADLQAPDESTDLRARHIPGTALAGEERAHLQEVIQRFVRTYCYENMPWREAQATGLIWAPLRKPHENAVDEHWLARGTFEEIDHPETGRSFIYPVSRWLSDRTSWQGKRRAPLLGEHTSEVLAELAGARRQERGTRAVPDKPSALSARGKPFALQNIRILDFSWFLASAGGTRFLASLGAECLKVEWMDNPDTRLAAMAPVGGRAAREAATAPLKGVTDPDMGGQFNNKNPGKRGLSLNIRDPRGLDIAKRLVAISDVVAEGFTPGVLERLGLGYDVMQSIKPDIIYVQQSGMGSHGKYGPFRTLGPVAAAFAGISDMSGLPEPAMPAGWGYSYLDWIGAYGFAQAILGALIHRERTGEGQQIDASQCEAGIFLTGAAILNWSANGRIWQRIGNRSPFKPAAPHGAYRCLGEDRWITIACFTEAEWRALAELAGRPDWASDPRFATLEVRLANQDALDAALSGWTVQQDAFACMYALQRAGVPAGVCQTAEDRCEHDPQLAALEWMTEVTGTKIGRWPVVEASAKLSATPAYAGGIIDRGAPCYGEDNQYVLRDLLGISAREIEVLAGDGVI